MDFLDPRKKRSHRIRLLIGYFLVSIAIALGTIILVYGAYGYSIDTKTGDIVENGLLFVDSKPGDAKIYLNGSHDNKTTSARLILPAGKYDLTLKKTGYRDWQRSFDLEEHSIARYVYPFLFPEKPTPANIKSYSTMPGLITQSPDRKWLILHVPNGVGQTISFEEIDSGKPTDPPRPLALPRSLFNTSGQIGTLTAVEWSSDNNYILLQNKLNAGVEFVIFDRREPGKSVNINQLFKVNPFKVALRNKKIDQVYIYDQPTQTLRLGNIGKGNLEAVLLNNVLAFKPYGANLLTYVTDKNIASGRAAARIWDNGRTYALTTFPTSSTYLIDAAQFQNDWYFVAGSGTGERINIYKDPIDQIRDPAIKRAVPITTLQIAEASEVAFSINTRFVGVQAGQNFAVFDFERKERYHYTLQSPSAGPMQWMDGHRLIGAAGGLVTVLDYDSTNLQTLVPTLQAGGGYFSRDYNTLFTLAPAASGQGASLQRTDMRAGADLPRAN